MTKPDAVQEVLKGPQRRPRICAPIEGVERLLQGISNRVQPLLLPDKFLESLEHMDLLIADARTNLPIMGHPFFTERVTLHHSYALYVGRCWTPDPSQ